MPVVPPLLIRTHDRARAHRLLTGGRPRPSRKVLRQKRRQFQVVRHPALRLVRAIAGWILIVGGLLFVILPVVPGFFLIPIGVVLVGRDSFLIRWTRVSVKLLLRSAEAWPGALGRAGRWLALKERHFSKKLRDRRIRRELRPQPIG